MAEQASLGNGVVLVESSLLGDLISTLKKDIPKSLSVSHRQADQ